MTKRSEVTRRRLVRQGPGRAFVAGRSVGSAAADPARQPNLVQKRGRDDAIPLRRSNRFCWAESRQFPLRVKVLFHEEGMACGVGREPDKRGDKKTKKASALALTFRNDEPKFLELGVNLGLLKMDVRRVTFSIAHAPTSAKIGAGKPRFLAQLVAQIRLDF